MNKKSMAILLLLLAFSLLLTAQEKVDQQYSDLIHKNTTDEKYLTPLVDYLPASSDIPTPLQHHGYIAGAEGEQTHYSVLIDYYETLAAKSDRMTILEIGKSHRGRMMVALVIADAEIIANLDSYREYTALLADPRKLNDSERDKILAKAKPFYLLSGGLHSPETGSPEMLMELTYRLLVSETEMIQKIRKNVITVIVPVLEIDGWDRQVDWYYRYTKKYENREDIPKSSPPYWGDYTAHDNNRDGIMLSQPLTQNVAKAFFDLHPQVTLDLHESVPLLYISTGTGPYYTSLDPIVKTEWQWLAFNEVQQMTSYGVPGVWTWGFYTGWYPGYLLWISNNHNSIGRFYETFGNGGANTYERTISETPGEGRTSEEWYRPSPPPAKVLWSLRNNTNLMQSGCLIALDFAARNGDTLLRNFWQKGQNALLNGASEKPYAWIIPTEQKDRLVAGKLLELLEKQKIETHLLAEDFVSGETRYPAGSLVVRMDQPYRNFAKTLFEIQKFPKNAKNRPYDATAWTVGLMLGVETARIDDAEILKAKMQPLSGNPFVGAVTMKKAATDLIIRPQGTGMIRALVALKDVDVFAIDSSLESGGNSYPAGSWLIDIEYIDALEDVCQQFKITAEAVTLDDTVSKRKLTFPRVGYYNSWFSTQDSGWGRYILDEAGIPYTVLDKDDVKAGKLGANFDVLIIPHHGGRASGLRFLRGIDGSEGPMPYTKTDEYKYLGTPYASDDITGGLGFDGLAEIEKFVQTGGTLITLGSGSNLVTDFGLLDGVSSQAANGLVCPGTLVTSWQRQADNPINFGFEKYEAVYRSSLPVLSVQKNMRKYLVAQFGTKLPLDEEATDDLGKKPALWQSGLLEGGNRLDGTAAIIDAPVGEGRIVLFGFNPFYRWMNHHDFSYAFNAIIHWDAPASLREVAGEK
jgi:hypothetical protein